MVTHFLFHVDFDVTSDTESTTGFWGKGLCFLRSPPTPSSNAPGMPEPGRPNSLSLIPPAM